jgi:Flp pilus assembly protein TadG
MTTANRRFLAEHGTAMVEMAVVLPLLVLVLVGTADFARVFYMAIELQNAARAGAQYGSTNLPRIGDDVGIKNAAQQAAPNLSLASTDITLTPPPPDPNCCAQCWCAPNDGSSFTPLANCSIACGSGHKIETITVTVTKTFTAISPLPGIPRPITLTRSATMRVYF